MTAPDRDDAHLIEQRLGGRVLLEGGFLKVHRDDVRLPDGSAATREYIRHGGAVAVVPLLDEGPDPRLVLVRQFRHPVAKVLLEIPAGKLEPGEAQLACAVRELAEETGYAAAEWAFGGEIHNAAAYNSTLSSHVDLVPPATQDDLSEYFIGDQSAYGYQNTYYSWNED